MRNLIPSRWPGLALTIALIAAMAFSAGSIVTARGQDDLTFYACESKNGKLHQIATQEPNCPRKDTLVSWNENGPIGPVGPAGPQGLQGLPGPQGETGAQGPAGPQGEAGPQGATGATGPQGDPGPRGEPGPQGADGADGPQGATGATGPVGATGAQGPAGVSGYERVVTDYTGQTPIAGAQREYSANCPSGKKVIGGGGDVSGITTLGWLLTASSAADDDTWVVTFTNTETTTPAPNTISITAICVTVGS